MGNRKTENKETDRIAFLRHLAKHRVLAVQRVRVGSESEEELRPVLIHAVVGHGDRAKLLVLKAVAGAMRVEAVAWALGQAPYTLTTDSSSSRIPSLCNKILLHRQASVEYNAFVQSLTISLLQNLEDARESEAEREKDRKR